MSEAALCKDGLVVVHAGELLEAQAVEVNEAAGVILVVILLGVVSLHGGHGVAVKAVRAAAAGVHHIALVELEANLTIHGFLGLGHEGLNGLRLMGYSSTS